jgi:prevent-host-death family protein
MKTITMTEFRREPGERIREVYREGKSFLVTKAGKPVAQLVPVDTIIEANGTIRGERPLTLGLNLGGYY